MATQDAESGPPSTLNPFNSTVQRGWAQERADPVQTSEQAKQSLKKMLERRRHNDAVRRLEFDRLRQLRHAEPRRSSSGAADSSLYADPSNLSDLDERATTLKKIDEIETQMSQQWWRGQPGEQAVAAHVRARPRPQPAPMRPAFEPTQTLDTLPLDEVMTTQMDHRALSAREDSLLAGTEPQLRPAQRFETTDHAVFATTLQATSDHLDSQILEEAAIRFANGEDGSAEELLKQAWQEASQTKPELANAWGWALFDLYRSTGQRAAFERFAAVFEQRLAGAPPPWRWFADPLPEAQPDAFEPTQILPRPDAAASVRASLLGELRGNCDAALASLQVPHRAALVVSCSGLIRVDVAAAGCLLNWAARAGANGGWIVLRDVSHLVGALFDLVGISEHARVMLRAD